MGDTEVVLYASVNKRDRGRWFQVQRSGIMRNQRHCKSWNMNISWCLRYYNCIWKAFIKVDNGININYYKICFINEYLMWKLGIQNW